MRPSTLLLRQIHPNFIDRGRITSQAFRPTRKDRDKLSVDNGDMVTAEESFRNYTEDGQKRSAGVLAVSVSECKDIDLDVLEDPLPGVPSHVLIDFLNISRAAKESGAKRLRDCGQKRGWLYRPS